MKKRYLVTAALPYANGPLHIGHLAGAYLPADVYARYLRLMERDVVFVCGSDEHGAAITMRARKEGVSPRDIVDRYHVMLRDTFAKIGIAFDLYHRTGEPLHHQTSQDIFRRLYAQGAFEQKTVDQYYDPVAEQFLADRYILGECPHCGNPDAYGDQCEKCGSSLSPNELIHPRSALSGESPILRPTSHWFLRLDQHEAWLREWINAGTADGRTLHDPWTWKNHVIGQCNSWLDAGLQPRAMTRDLDWGVDVPAEIPGAAGKKLYVWLDAPIGYISATKQWAADNGRDWEPYWKDQDTALIHFIGKDNIVFHCLIFPAILRAHGEFILPVNVPANQFMNLEGDKISTSRNWAVWAHEFCDEMPEHIDALRYYLIKNMPEQRDSEFTWKGFQESNDAELVNNLANFVNRVIVLTHKYYEGRTPECDPNTPYNAPWELGRPGVWTDDLRVMAERVEQIGAEIERFNFREALRRLMELSAAGNGLLQFNEPWKSVKTQPDQTRIVMNLALQFAASLACAMEPFMPQAALRLRLMLGLNHTHTLAALPHTLRQGRAFLAPGSQLGQAAHLFSRIPDDIIQRQMDKLVKKETPAPESPAPALNPPPAPKDTIAYEGFARMDIRTGRILSAEPMPKSKKLLRLNVDLGSEQRTILSGIAEHFKPEEVVGREVIVLANLAPRAMMGVESQGMILMAEDAAGRLAFVSPPAGWDAGYSVR